MSDTTEVPNPPQMRLGFAAMSVAGSSMAPTLLNGDVVFVRARPVSQGDVVVFDRDGIAMLKRAAERILPGLDGEPGGWWVLGDNPSASQDSRHFGVISDSEILGVAVLRLRRHLRFAIL